MRNATILFLWKQRKRKRTAKISFVLSHRKMQKVDQSVEQEIGQKVDQWIKGETKEDAILEIETTLSSLRQKIAKGDDDNINEVGSILAKMDQKVVTIRQNLENKKRYDRMIVKMIRTFREYTDEILDDCSETRAFEGSMALALVLSANYRGDSKTLVTLDYAVDTIVNDIAESDSVLNEKK